MTIATALRAVLLFAALAANAAERPENFVQWREGLASSAQPKADWLAAAGEQGCPIACGGDSSRRH
jgi:hypothetical protein